MPNDAGRAHCAACQKTFSLSNMGNTAVASHAASKKHQAAVSSTQSASQTNLRAFFTIGSNLPCSTTGDSDGAAVVPSPNTESAPANPVVVAPDEKAYLSGFLVKKGVTKAEILWCLNTIATHGSFRSAAASAALAAQRLVYDEVSAAGGVEKVDVTDKMIDMVRSANIRWKEELERKKQERLQLSDVERKKKRTAALVKELQLKKQKLMQDAEQRASMLQQEIESLKK